MSKKKEENKRYKHMNTHVNLQTKNYFWYLNKNHWVDISFRYFMTSPGVIHKRACIKRNIWKWINFKLHLPSGCFWNSYCHRPKESVGVQGKLDLESEQISQGNEVRWFLKSNQWTMKQTNKTFPRHWVCNDRASSWTASSNQTGIQDLGMISLVSEVLDIFF